MAVLHRAVEREKGQRREQGQRGEKKRSAGESKRKTEREIERAIKIEERKKA